MLKIVKTSDIDQTVSLTHTEQIFDGNISFVCQNGTSRATNMPKNVS